MQRVSPFDRQSTSWEGHLVLFHHNEHQRRTGIVAWARSGLESGAKLCYIEPPFEPADRALVGVLDAHGLDGTGAVAGGRIEVFTADVETYDSAWQARVGKRALAEGYSSVRWSGEAQTAWAVMSPAWHVDAEWEAEGLCASPVASVLCQYAAGLPQVTLQTVCAMHGAGIRDMQLQTSPGPAGVALAGSVDASNHRLLSAVLVAAASGRSHVEVDLRALEFFDVAAARALLAGTTQHRLSGGYVRLQGAEPAVGRVLRLLGVDRASGFELVQN